MESILFTRVESDINGNPRYSVDGVYLLKDGERIGCEDARKRANSIGGRKSRKGFTFTFQSYSIQATADAIGRVTGRTFKAEKS